MRIISGRFRGRQLEWVSDATTRPTTDRVKENIFNVLFSMGVDFGKIKVLDLFAGSGQMGIECSSRGSKDVIFNDLDIKARNVIKRNCASILPNAEVLGLSYIECLEKLKKRGSKFDLVFIDAPYKDLDAPINTCKYLRGNDMLADGGVIVVESENPDLVFDGYNASVKHYGRTYVYFLIVDIDFNSKLC